MITSQSLIKKERKDLSAKEMDLALQQTQAQKGNRSPMWVTSEGPSIVKITHFGKNDLNGLNLNSQLIREWVYWEGEKWVAN